MKAIGMMGCVALFVLSGCSGAEETNDVAGSDDAIGTGVISVTPNVIGLAGVPEGKLATVTITRPPVKTLKQTVLCTASGVGGQEISGCSKLINAPHLVDEEYKLRTGIYVANLGTCLFTDTYVETERTNREVKCENPQKQPIGEFATVELDITILTNPS